MTKAKRDEFYEFFTVVNNDMNTGFSRYDVDFNGIQEWIDHHFIERDVLSKSMKKNGYLMVNLPKGYRNPDSEANQ
jgi:hypothetical protein